MTITTFAKLDRGTVYLAGESVDGQVKFTNTGNEKDSKFTYLTRENNFRRLRWKNSMGVRTVSLWMYSQSGFKTYLLFKAT